MAGMVPCTKKRTWPSASPKNLFFSKNSFVGAAFSSLHMMYQVSGAPYFSEMRPMDSAKYWKSVLCRTGVIG